MRRRRSRATAARWPGPELGVGQALVQLEGGEDVALDVEVAGDVGPGEAELARRRQDAAQRVGRPEHERGRRVGRAELGAVVGPDGDRQVGARGRR